MLRGGSTEHVAATRIKSAHSDFHFPVYLTAMPTSAAHLHSRCRVNCFQGHRAENKTTFFAGENYRRDYLSTLQGEGGITELQLDDPFAGVGKSASFRRIYAHVFLYVPGGVTVNRVGVGQGFDLRK